MAIDFSQVKSLTIPEGEVNKITDSSGNVLWQKITKGWHTIFEGHWSQTIKGNSGRPTINICDLVECDAPLKLRITGTINTTITNPKLKFNWFGESEQDLFLNTLPFDISKEITITSTGIPANTSFKILYAICYRHYFERPSIEFNLLINKDTNILKFDVWDNQINADYNNDSFTINITKVEQYY